MARILLRIRFIALIRIIALIAILIFPFHPRISLSKSLFPVGLSVKILKAFLLSNFTDYILCPSQTSRINRPEYTR